MREPVLAENLTQGWKVASTLDRSLSIGAIFPLIGAHPTAAFLDFIPMYNISFEQAPTARQHDGGEHNRRETPLFVESIARRALARSSPDNDA